jgi:hypothetical protein
VQKAAPEKIKTVLTDGLSTALSDLAKGIVAFWGGLLVALAALVGEIISALGSSATIVGLPAAPVIAGGAAAAAVAAFTSGGLVLTSVAAGVNSVLRQKLHDDAAFRNGHWRPAVTI